MENKKCKIFLIGECFRGGGGGSTIRGTDYSFEDQKLASMTQINLLNSLKKYFKIDLEILTYKTKFDNHIEEWYSDFEPKITLFDNLIGITNLNYMAAKNSNEDYDFIFILRIDLIFKKAFLDNFNPFSDKITYPFVCWCVTPPNFNYDYVRHITSTGRHRVNHIMIFVPKRYINDYVKLVLDRKIISVHEDGDNMTDDMYNNLGYMIDTYHDADSAKDKNPLYRIANRPESTIWYSENYRLDKKPIYDTNKSYLNVFKNEEYLI